MKIKELIELLKVKLPGTKYDRFWVESIIKRFSTIEKISPIFEALESSQSPEAFIEFIKEHMMSEEERVKAKVAKQQEESKEIDLDSGWNKDEIALMTRAITKFPPGTKDRWLTVANFVGSKTQKDCIKKA